MSGWPVEVASDGNVSVGAVVWSASGRLRLTVIAKASFDLVHERDVALRAPEPLVREDRSFGGHPLKSLEAASDLAPYLERCDVWLQGTAHSPGGKPVIAGAVRLAAFRDTTALFDKALHVFADRDAAGAPIPFTRMPIVYERARGGVGFPANPAGSETPNIVDPADATRPIGFGPLSRYWGVRKKLLAAADRAGLESPIPTIAGEAVWPDFQAAPLDQRIPYLRGGEWIVLDGLHPTLPRVQSRLLTTGARALFGSRESPRRAPIDLVADTLAIDADQQRCSIVWRGHCDIAGWESALQSIVIACALELPGKPIAWDRVVTVRDAAPAKEARDESAGESTTMLGQGAPIAGLVSPFPIAPPSAHASLPARAGIPWAEAARGPASTAVGEGTIAATSVGEGTIALRPNQQSAARPVAPFAIAAPKESAHSASAAATPWARDALAPAPAVVAGEATIGLGGVFRAPAASPAPAPPTAPAPAPPIAQAVAPPSPAPPNPPNPPPAPAKAPEPIAPRTPQGLADKLLGAGANQGDVAALLRAMKPPPPPADDDD